MKKFIDINKFGNTGWVKQMPKKEKLDKKLMRR